MILQHSPLRRPRDDHQRYLAYPLGIGESPESTGRSEVRAAKNQYLARDLSSATTWRDVTVSYDDVMALPYLDAVIRETLRVYSPSSVHS